ncbi:TonB-dependent receptor [Paraflavisolibacter sp. H34]|uniref:TonB-dependent receptor n=1 Tax=Huijunlia imazamoxiresistens TaxID=3127457 RepID=UPI0030188A1F
MKQLFISLLACLISLVTLAQQKKGVVYDADTKEPLAGATITTGDRTLTTDEKGQFPFAGRATTAEISSAGYVSRQVSLAGPAAIALQRKGDRLQEVVVTANRQATLRSQVPVAISQVTPRMLEEARAVSVYEVINKMPGVLMVNYNNEQHAMSIRQPMGTSNYYLYMEDGVPIRPMGVFNHNALLEVNQYAISSIEVVKGPASSIYGPEAVGGAVNFITQRPTAVPTARVGVQFDQFGYRRVQAGAGARLGRLGIYAGGLVSDQHNSWMASSDYSKNTWNLRAEYQFNERTRLTAASVYSDYFSQTAGSVDSLAFYTRTYQSPTDFTYRKSTALRNRLTLEHRWDSSAHSFLTLFHRFNEHGQNPAYAIRWTTGQATARGEINSSNFNSYGVIAQHTQQFAPWNTQVLVGGLFDYSPTDYWSYQVDLDARLRTGGKSVENFSIRQERPDIRLADYAAAIRNAALYAQLETEPLRHLRLVFGARFDRMSFTYDNFLDKSSGNKRYEQATPKLGLTYNLRGKGFYANFSQGFAPPSLTAIFRRKPNSDPAEFYYNLEPGRFHNYEVGGWAALWNNKIYADGSLYQMEGRNELLSIRQPDNSTDYQSAGKTLHRGVEYGLSVRPNRQLAFRFGGTTALHRFEDFLVSTKATDAVKKLDGFEMPSAPRTTFNTEVSYYPAWLSGLRTALEWQHVDGWFQDQINSVRSKGYDLLNLRAGYQWKGVEVFTNVLNLADALYATSATRGNNATDRTTFTPAAPRTFVMGLQYQFTAKK